MGGGCLEFDGVTATYCTYLLTTKVLMNSTISTPGTKFMTMGLKDFYCGTAMARYEYMKLALACTPEK